MTSPHHLRVRRRLVAGVLGLAVLFVAVPAAQAVEEGGAAYAVQKRRFLLSHEVSFGVGVLPMDAFYKGIGLKGAYSYHFGEALGWEVAQITYSVNIGTGVSNRLRNDWNVMEIPEPRLQFIATSSLIIKPLFGKLAFSNRKIVHLEVYFVVGGGVTKTTTLGVNPTIDVGAGFRFYAFKHLSFFLDVRDYLAFDSLNPTHFLFIGIGVSPMFGKLRKTKEEKRAAREKAEADAILRARGSGATPGSGSEE